VSPPPRSLVHVIPLRVLISTRLFYTFFLFCRESTITRGPFAGRPLDSLDIFDFRGCRSLYIEAFAVSAVFLALRGVAELSALPPFFIRLCCFAAAPPLSTGELFARAADATFKAFLDSGFFLERFASVQEGRCGRFSPVRPFQLAFWLPVAKNS